MEITTCFRCRRPITTANNSEEHIIPNAIGGRKKVGGFICRGCNSTVGSKWDAALTRKLNPLALLLGITRQRGSVRPEIFDTLDGNAVRMNADGKMSLAKPTFDKKTDGATTRIQIRAGTKEEALHILKGVREKYPQLRHRKVDEIYSAFQEKSHYDPSPLRIELDFGGVDCGRSIVKSAVALVFEAGIRPEQCNIALSYLLSDGEEPCFGYYYTKYKDIILNRPPQTPIHCVYVEGRSEESSIVGYIELFSLWRIVFCLSDTYKGSDFTHAYAVDPIKGEELDVSVNLDLSLSEIHGLTNMNILTMKFTKM